MRPAMGRVFCVACALIASTVALADETAVTLKDGPGREVVLNNCAACHSLDYIQMNSPFLDRKLWDAEVTKMIKVFGAPIDDADAKAITDYLAKNYGSGGPS
jgi:mono/diheme cytochrome c family protein